MKKYDANGRPYEITNPHGVAGFWSDEIEDNPFSFNWLGATVEFNLLGRTLRGEVEEAFEKYHTFTPHHVVIEFFVENRQARICLPYQAVKRVPADGR